MMSLFAGMFAALYVGGYVGDIWAQTDKQAAGKGKAGREGRVHCIEHCLTYVATQGACVALVMWVTGQGWGNDRLAVLAFVLSGVAHYAMDRREHGILPWLVKHLKQDGMYALGRPRGGHYDDAPHLGTGAFHLDQSWHLLTSVFLPALLLAVTL